MRCRLFAAAFLTCFLLSSCSRVGEATGDLQILSKSTESTTTSGPTTTVPSKFTTTTVRVLKPHNGPLVTTAGFGKVFFGMKVAQAEAALDTTIEGDDSNAGCWVGQPSGIIGVSFVVSFGHIERVDVIAGPVTTRSGIGIGTPEDIVLQLLGENVELSTTEVGNRITFTPSNTPEFQLVFDTDGAEVVQFRGGRLPIVSYNDCR